MKKRYYLLGVIVLIIGSFFYNYYFTQSMLVGTYVNNYRIGMYVYGEDPSSIDTLRLYKNNRYKSYYWGDGTYEIYNEGILAYVHITPEFRAGGFGGSVQRRKFKPAIMISSDLNYYYRKID